MHIGSKDPSNILWLLHAIFKTENGNIYSQINFTTAYKYTTNS